jgi:hypothetical protein
MNPHFASLVLGLAQQAEATLGGTLPPGAAEAGATDTREIARSLIDTLGMLDQKTKGNLEPDEAALLTQAITALRFTFVKRGGGGPG